MSSFFERFAPFFGAFLITLLITAEARADLASPNEENCRSASEGATCKVELTSGTGTGTCQKSSCWSKDYANWDRDASPNGPPQKSEECLLCRGKDGGPITPDDDGGDGCAVGVHSPTREVGSWLIALSIPALIFALRKRAFSKKR